MKPKGRFRNLARLPKVGQKRKQRPKESTDQPSTLMTGWALILPYYIVAAASALACTHPRMTTPPLSRILSAMDANAKERPDQIHPLRS